MAYLVLVRHGLTEYNAKGIWTGWDDPELTPEGFDEAKRAGENLKDIHFDYAFTSDLIRAKQTLKEILTILRIPNLPTSESRFLRERNYGDYTRRNKWEIKKEIGEQAFHKLRRSWDYPVPNGESLKQVYIREIPYFESEILPIVKSGKNVIIVSSGNALRALVKYLEKIPDDLIASLEIGTGEVYVYTVNSNGDVITKEVRSSNPLAGKV